MNLKGVEYCMGMKEHEGKIRAEQGTRWIKHLKDRKIK